MSDELVKELRHSAQIHTKANKFYVAVCCTEAADRIEAQAREIEELKRERDEAQQKQAQTFSRLQDYGNERDRALHRAEAAEARVAALTEALKRIANTFDDSWREGSLERMLGDTARHALTENTDAR